MKGHYSVKTSTYSEPRMATAFVDNRYGRDSYEKYDDGKPMTVELTVIITPAADMDETLERLLSAVESAGFVRG